MTPQRLYLRHLAISLSILFVLVGGLFFFSSYIKGALSYPQSYLGLDVPASELSYSVAFISLIIVAVLISYLSYLLLAAKSRAELVVWGATRQLAESKEQFRRLYEDAPVPYITLDAKGDIHEPNKAALRFFGVLPEEIEGKSLFSFALAEDQNKASKLLQRYTYNMPINREEIRMTTKSGDVRFILLSVFETKGPEAGHRGIASIFDVTEEKKLDQAKTEFVSLASHQLRTPLATIKWFMDMILSKDLGELAPRQREYAEKIYAVNQEMSELVDTLLNVSRIEIGTLPIEKKPTDVQALVESIFTELSSQISVKQLAVEKSYNDSLRSVNTDPKLLRIVIQNLLSNAVKYTPDGGTVRVSLVEGAGKNSITVSDSGMGIPRAEQGKVFTKLFRADNVRKESKAQGTGLGLYLVKSIVENLGGSISFVSEENKGSDFTVVLDP